MTVSDLNHVVEEVNASHFPMGINVIVQKDSVVKTAQLVSIENSCSLLFCIVFIEVFLLSGLIRIIIFSNLLLVGFNIY